MICLLLFLFIQLMSCTACSGIDLNFEKEESQDVPTEEPMEETEYIAIFGDIQYYTNPVYIHTYQYSVDWILSQARTGKRIDCVLHTGDITQSNSITQWQFFYDATKELASEVPYFSMIGDHDYKWDGALINSRDSTHFNEYLDFPLTHSKVVAYFEEGKMENVVIENQIHGQRFDLLILEFGPRKEVVEWADDYVKTHPDIRFILMNHEYLEKGGGRRTNGLKCVARLRNTTYTTPEQLWNNLVKCNDNIRVVLCGHVGGLYALTVDTNDFGRSIPQIQHNIQSAEYRHDNWLMLWEFPAYSDSANVCIYNTLTGQFYNNKEILFKFKYRDPVKPVGLGEIRNVEERCKMYGINGIQTFGPQCGIMISEEGKKVLK